MALAADARALIEKVKYVHPPELEDKFAFHVPGIVTVILKSGEKLTSYMESPRGRPENPMTRKELYAKFRHCSRSLLSKRAQDGVIRLVRNLEDNLEIGGLLQLLSAG